MKRHESGTLVFVAARGPGSFVSLRSEPLGMLLVKEGEVGMWPCVCVSESERVTAMTFVSFREGWELS